MAGLALLIPLSKFFLTKTKGKNSGKKKSKSLTELTREWVVVGSPLEEATKVTLDYKAPMAAAIMIAMVAAMVFDFLNIAPVTAVMIAAVLLAPIAYQAAIGLHLSPYPFLFAVSVGACMCFASPFSTPPNALVMPAGQYSFIGYVRVGLPIQVILGIIMVFVLPLLFPF